MTVRPFSSFLLAMSLLLSGGSAFWHVPTRADEAPRPTVNPPITALALSPDGHALLVGSQAGLEVRTWPGLKPLKRLATKLPHIHDLAFSPDGSTLAVAGGEPAERGSVELWDWPNQTLTQRFHPHEDLVYAIAWRGDSGMLVTASADQRVGLHDPRDGKTQSLLEGHSRGVLAVAFLPGAAGLVTAGIDETIRLWHPEGRQLVRALTNHTRPVTGLAVPSTASEGPPLLASISEDRTVRIWQPTIGRLVRFARSDQPATAIRWSADGQRLWIACTDGHVRSINTETTEVISDIPAIAGVAYSLLIAPDGSLVVGGQHGELRRIVP